MSSASVNITISTSLVNGLVAGAGIVLALMSFGFIQYVETVESIEEVTKTQLHIAIFLGVIVAAVSIVYEFYSKKDKTPKKETQSEKTDSKIN